MKLLRIILAALVLSAPCHAFARKVVDQAGREVEIPADPGRIISLAPSITEVVFSLGKGNLLKGATLYSDDPPEARKLPRVGSYVQLDIEKIVALRPDLCLAIKDGNPIHTVNRIESLGVPVYVVNPRSLESIVAMVDGLGNILGAAERAERITGDMRARMEKIRNRLGDKIDRPKVFFQIDAAPIVSAGRNTFIDELIVTAGGINLAANAGTAYPKFSWEDILALQPEVAIVASMAGGFSAEDLRSGWQRWPQLPAVKNKRVHVVDAGLVDRPTPRLIDGLETFAAIIHPELFGKETDD